MSEGVGVGGVATWASSMSSLSADCVVCSCPPTSNIAQPHALFHFLPPLLYTIRSGGKIAELALANEASFKPITMNAIQNLNNQKPTTDSNVHLNVIHVSNLLELRYLIS